MHLQLQQLLHFSLLPQFVTLNFVNFPNVFLSVEVSKFIFSRRGYVRASAHRDKLHTTDDTSSGVTVNTGDAVTVNTGDVDNNASAGAAPGTGNNSGDVDNNDDNADVDANNNDNKDDNAHVDAATVNAGDVVNDDNKDDNAGDVDANAIDANANNNDNNDGNDLENQKEKQKEKQQEDQPLVNNNVYDSLVGANSTEAVAKIFGQYGAIAPEGSKNITLVTATGDIAENIQV